MHLAVIQAVLLYNSETRIGKKTHRVRVALRYKGRNTHSKEELSVGRDVIQVLQQHVYATWLITGVLHVSHICIAYSCS